MTPEADDPIGAAILHNDDDIQSPVSAIDTHNDTGAGDRQIKAGSIVATWQLKRLLRCPERAIAR